jgi:hypothetical protein
MVASAHYHFRLKIAQPDAHESSLKRIALDSLRVVTGEDYS